MRAEVDAAVANPGPENRETAHEVFGEYTDMVATIFASHDRFALVVDDASLRQGDDLVHYSSHATDSVAQLVDQLLYVGWGTGGHRRAGGGRRGAEVARDVERNNAAVRTRGTGDYAAPTERFLADRQVALFGAVRLRRHCQRGTGRPGCAAGDDTVGCRQPLPGLPRSGGRRARAARRRLAVRGGRPPALVHRGGAGGRARGCVRRLAGQSLDHAAAAGAQPRRPIDCGRAAAPRHGRHPRCPPGRTRAPKPVPIEVTTSDEVSDVAEALDDVQRSALGLAVEQATLRRTIAESYVNLGRRNQNLLSRLLAAIGDLEQGEADPERIAQLHKVDHLATHAPQRRIAPGAEPGGRGPHWHPPVRVLDVVRAALGEIENYQRVVVRTLDPVMVVGGAASDLTHLLAELIENGVKHSPPHELVEIRERLTLGRVLAGGGRSRVGHERRGHRRGQPAAREAEAPTVALSKHLGHFVAALRWRATASPVRLQGSEVVGIAAIIDLPAAIIGPMPPNPCGSCSPRRHQRRRPGHRPGGVGRGATRPWPAPASPPPSPATRPSRPPVRAGPGGASAGPGHAGATTGPRPPDSRRWRRPPSPPAGWRGVPGARPGAAGPLGPAGPLAVDPARRPTRPGVDPAEIQRFLTSLAAGVQRSLADTDTERDRESQ